MATHLIDAGDRAFPIKRSPQVLLAYRYPFFQAGRGMGFAGRASAAAHEMFYFAKYPGIAYRGAADHDAVHPVTIPVFQRTPGTIDIPVAEDRNMDAGVVLHFCDKRPVGMALI